MLDSYRGKINKAIKSPISAPRVTDDPIAIIKINTGHLHAVIQIIPTGRHDAATIRGPVRSVKTDRQRASREHIILHGCLPPYYMKVINGHKVVAFATITCAC